MNLNIYLVGVGGQGILTIGEILSSAAMEKDLPVFFYPSKGMAQRGGFVKAQLQIGKKNVGPNIIEKGSDIVFAMETSEALKAVRFAKPGGTFLLLANFWAPTDVILGKASYPELDKVIGEIQKSGAKLVLISDKDLPEYEGKKVADNIFMLGAAMKHSVLNKLFDSADIDRIVQNRWKRASASNHFAFQAGMDYQPQLIAGE
ncbi:MAG: hypothetical protein GX933_04035 [Chloroflexi bacterium]|jgi:indolepyruvate ferredoxin oxidoreductase beta subunit|nr:hypothetical protein [Chloroflexota bacterium]